MNLESICSEVVGAAKETGAFIKKERESFSYDKVDRKSNFRDLVSHVDVNAEKMLVKKLEEIIPESGFITEEGTIDKREGAYKWIIDPLDGTTNFIHNIPCYSVSIGLQHEAEIVLGVVYEVTKDECFYAWKDSAAYLNGNEIKVSKAEALEHALMATGFAYNLEGEKLETCIYLFREFLRKSQSIRRLGSAAVDLVYVACGRFEGFYEYNLNPWDVAGGAIIVQQAGGVVVNFSGENDFLYSKEIIAASPGVYQAILDIFKEAKLEVKY